MRSKSSAERPMSVLIVDDDDLIRKFVERVLSESGYRTAVASGGDQALEIAATFEPLDLLVTDLMMPQMTGDELARRIRANNAAVKVLYITGYSDRLFKEKVTLWADEAFLDKPCTVAGLLQAVSLLLFGRLDVKPEATE
jgi:two-component system cell cycle sensor histidine kinase/response regulator CckA